MLKEISEEKLRKLCYLAGVPLVGVYLRDQIPQGRPNKGLYIFNLDHGSSAVGTHWVGLFVTSREIYYFDSFGAPPPIEVMKFIERKKKTHKENGWIFQDINSSSCGYFVFLFGYYVAKYGNVEKFSDLFVNSTAANERILVRNLYNILSPLPHSP